MTVTELIEELKQMPPDAEVRTHWDGELRGDPDIVWLTRDGAVAIGETWENVYSDESRPDWAPSAAEDPYWRPKKNPGTEAGANVESNPPQEDNCLDGQII